MAKVPDHIVKRVRQEMAAAGGRARAASLTAEQRRAIAKRAGKKRWARHRTKRNGEDK
jgi:hypothetical protein